MPPVPQSLDWKLWLGGAPERPYHPIYHPFNWRGWVDFGTGAIGDMACHSLHVIFRALDLKHPVAVNASSTVIQRTEHIGERVHSRPAEFPETFPASSIVTWDFPHVRLHWYDGGLKPARPLGMPPQASLGGSGILFVGDKGVLRSGYSGGPAMVSPAHFTPPEKTLPRVLNHYQEWIAAAKGGPPAQCNFEFGSLLAETAVLGTVAIRAGTPLLYDANEMRITNDANANELLSL
jgi:hypothetical protein